jgi:hypothetical protein
MAVNGCGALARQTQGASEKAFVALGLTGAVHASRPARPGIDELLFSRDADVRRLNKRPSIILGLV